jgi:uncharacterized protein
MPAPPAQREFLGAGWRFPPQVGADGRIAMAKYEQRVEESIVLILATARGERVMVPEFGCGIHELVFAPSDARTVALVAHEVRRALVAFETRIDLLDVHVDSAPEAPNLLLIRVNYRVRATNAIANLVYPFYIREGR